MESILEQLGMTQEELRERLMSSLVERMLTETVFSMDEDGDEVQFERKRKFVDEIEKRVLKASNEKIDELFNKHILPQVSLMIDNIVIQNTNSYGEKKGEPITFLEYLVKRANEYITETVNYDGKTKAQVGSYNSFSGKQTRIAYMIDQHLQYSIGEAMKRAINTANEQFADGLAEACKIQLRQLINKLNVKIEKK